MSKTQDNWLHKNWLQVSMTVLIPILLFALYTSPVLPAGLSYSANEIHANSFASNVWNIAHNPSFLPYYLLVWLPSLFGHSSVLLARIVSAIFGIATVLLSYFVLRSFFSQRIAFMGSLLVAFSSALLYSSHLGTPDILLLFGQALLFATLPLYHRVWHHPTLIYLIVLLLGIIAYIPGVVWLIAVWLLFQIPAISALLKRITIPHKIGLSALVIIVLSPLIYASATHLASLWQLLALPQHVPTFSELGHRAQSVLSGLIWKYDGGEGLALFRGPILSIIELGLGLLGLFAQFKRPLTKSNVFILVYMALAFALAIISGLSYLVLMPILFALMASGIYTLLIGWQEVFPVNPFARSTANLIIIALIAMTIVFHVWAFFVAWPHSPAAHRLFTHSTSNISSSTDASPSSFSY